MYHIVVNFSQLDYQDEGLGQHFHHTFSQWNDKEYYRSILSISRSVGESKGELLYFTLQDNYQKNVHTREGLVVCTA